MATVTGGEPPGCQLPVSIARGSRTATVAEKMIAFRDCSVNLTDGASGLSYPLLRRAWSAKGQPPLVEPVRHAGGGWLVDAEAARNRLSPQPELEPLVKKPAKSSKTIRANKRKATLRAKHRRQRARATG